MGNSGPCAKANAWLPSQWSPWKWLLNTATTGKGVTLRITRKAIWPICKELPESNMTTPAEVTTKQTLDIMPRFSGVGKPSGA